MDETVILPQEPDIILWDLYFMLSMAA